MKKYIKTVSAVAGLLLVTFASLAADSFSTGNLIATSTANTNAFPTNGLYGSGILANVIVTNIVPIGNVAADTTSIQVQGAAMSASTTNLVFQIWAAVAPVSLSVNTNQGANPGCRTNNATTPLALFDTITLPLNGTTLVCTNKCYGPATTPSKGKALNLYLYSVQMGAGTVGCTNYSVTVANY